MTTRVGINRFGRIGRQVLKAMLDYHPDTLEVVAFNDIGDMATMAHLLKYDSNYGKFDGTVEIIEDGLLVNGRKVKAFKDTDPAAIPWGDLGVEIVVEGTGIFTVKEDGVNKKGKTVKGAVNHITAGKAKKVIITAPAEGEDLTVVLGVNAGGEGRNHPAARHDPGGPFVAELKQGVLRAGLLERPPWLGLVVVHEVLELVLVQLQNLRNFLRRIIPVFYFLRNSIGHLSLLIDCHRKNSCSILQKYLAAVRIKISEHRMLVL